MLIAGSHHQQPSYDNFSIFIFKYSIFQEKFRTNGVTSDIICDLEKCFPLLVSPSHTNGHPNTSEIEEEEKILYSEKKQVRKTSEIAYTEK